MESQNTEQADRRALAQCPPGFLLYWRGVRISSVTAPLGSSCGQSNGGLLWLVKIARDAIWPELICSELTAAISNRCFLRHARLVPLGQKEGQDQEPVSEARLLS